MNGCLSAAGNLGHSIAASEMATAYSMDLERDAQKYANTCPSNGSTWASGNYTGENFGMVPSNPTSSYFIAVYQAIKSFWDEIKVNSIPESLVFTESPITPRRFTQ
ncbi:hypothetical protein OSTOST_15638, partial [Ostertagia ostertagi]